MGKVEVVVAVVADVVIAKTNYHSLTVFHEKRSTLPVVVVVVVVAVGRFGVVDVVMIIPVVVI